jgi:AcrR family transcriptional regulator
VSTRAPRKRLTAEERRVTILDAALSVFAERGFHGTSIDDIARAAGISKALIYEHFASKEQLHMSLLEQNAGELFERLAGAVAAVESAERLSAGLDAFFAFVEERRGAWRMLFRETADPDVAAVMDRVVAQVTAVVAALIAADPGARMIGDDEARRLQAIDMLAQMLVGAVQSLANWWADNRDVPRRQLVELSMDFAWLGLERLSRGERWIER